MDHFVTNSVLRAPYVPIWSTQTSFLKIFLTDPEVVVQVPEVQLEERQVVHHRLGSRRLGPRKEADSALPGLHCFHKFRQHHVMCKEFISIRLFVAPPHSA